MVILSFSPLLLLYLLFLLLIVYYYFFIILLFSSGHYYFDASRYDCRSSRHVMSCHFLRDDITPQQFLHVYVIPTLFTHVYVVYDKSVDSLILQATTIKMYQVWNLSKLKWNNWIDKWWQYSNSNDKIDVTLFDYFFWSNCFNTYYFLKPFIFNFDLN